MSLFLEETLFVTEVQVGRQPHGFWCLNLLLFNSGDCFTHGCGPGVASALTGRGGRITLPGAAIPRLPNNPSRRPGKKLLSMGLSAARPTMMSGATSGCLRGLLHSNSCTGPRWSVILEESSPIRFFVPCGDRNSSRWDWMNVSISSRASSS